MQNTGPDMKILGNNMEIISEGAGTFKDKYILKQFTKNETGLKTRSRLVEGLAGWVDVTFWCHCLKILSFFN